MPRSNTEQYCAAPEVLRLLAQDGLGWGHDLQCGVFTAQTQTDKKEGK